MYTEQDIKDISAQIGRRCAAVAVSAAVLIGAIILSFRQRAEAVTVALTILLCFSLLFTWGLFLSPLVRYKKYLSSVLYGMNRTTEGRFKSFSGEQSERDGVLFTDFLINVGNNDDEEDDRLFYWDARLPQPAWKTGVRLSITSQDKAVIRWAYLP